MTLEEMPNIGKTIAVHLRAVGIDTPEKLKEKGAEEAFIQIRLKVDNDACFSQLCALEGATQNIRWHDLSSERKENLRSFYESLQ